MPNAIASALAAPFSSLKQLNSQAVNSVNSLNTGLITSLNQGLDALSAGAPPPLPGIGGQQAAFPTPASLMPANLSESLSNIENVLIPAGFPKLSQAVSPAAQQQEKAPPSTPAQSQGQPAAASTPARITQFRGM